ncbi:helix-turn-helix domain-containing protein [Streptomyces sp. NPDC057092]|uniref:helix-turn-helix domain-containing protein n=1 Tax=Streptomyces sp. NPDC057092 TaxID=3346017 RepID=UPI00363C224C
MPAHWKPVRAVHGRRGKFAEKLREVMHRRGVSPAEIAAQADVSRATVYAVLAGERLPTQHLLDCITAYTRVGERQPTPLPRRLAPQELAKQLDRLQREARLNAPPPAPVVRVASTQEQQKFTEALNRWVEEYLEDFPYYWPESEIGEKGVTRGWLQRFQEGRAIPSEIGLGRLVPVEKPPKMSGIRWMRCLEEHDNLQRLAFEARRSRRAAQAVARILQGRR